MLRVNHNVATSIQEVYMYYVNYDKTQFDNFGIFLLLRFLWGIQVW